MICLLLRRDCPGKADGFVLAGCISAQTGAHAYLLSLTGNVYETLGGVINISH